MVFIIRLEYAITNLKHFLMALKLPFSIENKAILSSKERRLPHYTK